MLPFTSFFGLKIPMYGLMITLGVLLGTLVAMYLPASRKFQREDLFFSVCYAGVGAIVGAKTLYIFITLPAIVRQKMPMSFALFRDLITNGFVFYGGLIGAIVAVLIYARQFRLPFLQLTETLVPAIPLMHALGRIGCFCAGCCYGLPMDSPWGVVFSSPLAPPGVALFPVQLLEAFLNFVLFAVVFLFSRSPRKLGRVLGLYLVSYGVMRFGLEFLRYDSARGMALGLSTSQWISLVLVPIGLSLVVHGWRCLLFHNTCTRNS